MSKGNTPGQRELERSESEVWTDTGCLKTNGRRHISIPPISNSKQLCLSRGVHQKKTLQKQAVFSVIQAV